MAHPQHIESRLTREGLYSCGTQEKKKAQEMISPEEIKELTQNIDLFIDLFIYLEVEHGFSINKSL